uniref:Uncharacterized protein n=1 Tax=Ditylenchus dipsaci TaxID=166011 RepID=A0A915DZE0_9BILA
MRLHMAAPTPLPRQYHHSNAPTNNHHPIAPQHHRSSEGALTYSGATLLGATNHYHNTRLSLDTKDEYYLHQLRRASQFEASRSSHLFDLFYSIRSRFYINSMSAKHLSNDVSTSMSAERILGAKFSVISQASSEKLPRIQSNEVGKVLPQSGLLPVASQAVVTPLHYLDYLQDQKICRVGKVVAKQGVGLHS